MMYFQEVWIHLASHSKLFGAKYPMDVNEKQKNVIYHHDKVMDNFM